MDYVIDANVALKWFFKEKYSENAAVLLKRLNSGVDRVHAPELLLVEVAHRGAARVRAGTIAATNERQRLCAGAVHAVE